MRLLPRRPPTALVCALAAAAVAAVLVTGPGASAATATSSARAATPVKIKPNKLPRAADAAVPHIEGSTLVDGSLEVRIASTRPDYLGRSGKDYLVHARDDQGVGPVVRVTPAGATTTVLTPAGKGDLVVLSTDGDRLAQAVPQRGFKSTRLTVWSTSDGSVVATKSYPRLVSVLDLDSTRVLVGSTQDTTTWKTSSGLVRKVTSRYGYLADLATDRLATFTGDPYDGGCTVVSTISDPRKKLWKNCDLRVDSFSTDGKRAAAVDLLADGIGPSVVLVVSNRGVVKTRYGVRGYFGLLTWESPRSLLLESFGRQQSALVRCTGATCERATDLAPTPAYRLS